VIKQLAELVEGYRELPEMHRRIARTELANPQALRDIAAYLNALPPVDKPEHGDRRQLPLGGRIYKSICAECHGARGEGDVQARIPALRGQHYSYVLRQMRQLATGHRDSVDLALIVVLEALSLQQLTAVADFISRLPASSEAESFVAEPRNRESADNARSAR
jgi:cytochrome c553